MNQISRNVSFFSWKKDNVRRKDKGKNPTPNGQQNSSTEKVKAGGTVVFYKNNDTNDRKGVFTRWTRQTDQTDKQTQKQASSRGTLDAM